MFSLQFRGPMRLPAPHGLRCGGRLREPLPLHWLRPGTAPLPLPGSRDTAVFAKRGRPRKDQQKPPEDAAAEAVDEKPKRGRKSRKEKAQEEARDLLESQQVNLEVLEEFKARAAAEEEAKRAAMGDSGEDDPRRLNFHRALLTASARGLFNECARIIDSMIDAGLTPGPRAVHVWAYSYITIGDGRAARKLAEEAAETFGVEWIPETYVAMMHAALSCNGKAGPDLVGALELWVAMQDAGANPQLGFTFLAKELFRLRYSALAMQVVSEGYAAGLQPDEKLAALVIEQLCKQGLQTEAQAEMQRLLAAGLTVSPDHYDPLLRMEAARGSLPAARAMLAAMAADARFAPPTVSSYNALLKGLVSALQPVAAPGEEGVVEGLKGGRVAMSAEEVEVAMTAVKEEMVGRGLRPSRETHAAMVEAFAVVGDHDGAMTAYETMTRAGGNPALLRKKYLGRLVTGLLLADRPYDAARILRDCSETLSFTDARMSVTLPASAAAPLPDAAAGGRSALTAWVPAHLAVMRQRRGQRASVAAFMKDADMSSRREVDGVVLGMGGCVVSEDGLFIPPARMSVHELRTELTAGGVDVESVPAGAAGKKELIKLAKERRAALPPSVLNMQYQLKASIDAEEAARAEEAEEAAAAQVEQSPEMAEYIKAMEEYDDDDEPVSDLVDENITNLIAETGTFEGAETMEASATFRAAAAGRAFRAEGMGAREDAGEDEYDPFAAMAYVEDEDQEEDEELEDDDDEVDDDDMAEAFETGGAAMGLDGRRRRRRGEDEDDDEDDELPDDGLEAVDELGMGMSVEEKYGLDVVPRKKVDSDQAIINQIMAMNVTEAAQYNSSAGAAVATFLLDLWGRVGLAPTPADLMALYEAALAEEHPRTALEVARMLPDLVLAGAASREELTSMLSALADVCLKPPNPNGEAGDTIIGIMEDAELPVPADLYAALKSALKGKSRTREAAGGAPLDVNAAAAVGDEEQEGELDEGLEGEEGEQLLLGAGEEGEEGEAAEGEEEAEEGEDEDEEVFGEYEDDPGQEEIQRLEALFTPDPAQQDDAWMDEMDELDGAADVEEIRAAAEAEAAAAARTAALEAQLSHVAEWNPAAAQILEARLEAAVSDLEQAEAAAAEAAKDPAAAAALAEERALAAEADTPDLLDAIIAGAAGRQLPALTAALPPSAPAAADAATAVAAAAAPDVSAAGMDALMESLPQLTAEALWQTTPLGEMPPAVLAEALAATAVDLGEAGMLSEKDRDLFKSMVRKAQLLEEFRTASALAAQQHPEGEEGAEAEALEGLKRLREMRANGTYDERTEAAILSGQLNSPTVDESLLPGEISSELEEFVEVAKEVLSVAGEEQEEEGEGEEGEAQALKAAALAGWGLGLEPAKGEELRQLVVRLEEEEERERLAAGIEEITEEQDKLFDLVEAGDVAALSEAVAPEALQWFLEELRRETQGDGEDEEAAGDVETEGGEAEAEGEDDLGGLERVLDERFVAALHALRDAKMQEVLGATDGEADPPDGEELKELRMVATVQALVEMANMPPGTYVPEDLSSHPIDVSDLEEGEEGEEEEPAFVPIGQPMQQPDEGMQDVLEGGERVAKAAEALQEALGGEDKEQQEAVAAFHEAVTEQLALLDEEYRIANEEATEAAKDKELVVVNPNLARQLLGMLQGEDRAAGPVYVADAIFAEGEEEKEEEAPAAAAGGAGKGKGKGKGRA